MSKTTPYYLTVPESIEVTKTMVEDLGYKTLSKYNATDWRIVWGDTKRALGRCRFISKTIELSSFFFVRLVDKRLMLDVVLHEIAHVLAGLAEGHNYIWKRWCVTVGALPEREQSYDCVVVGKNDFKYSLVCKKHGIVAGISRKVKRNYSCPKCCPKYNDKYRLEVVQNW